VIPRKTNQKITIDTALLPLVTFTRLSCREYDEGFHDAVAPANKVDCFVRACRTSGNKLKGFPISLI
jgi:hypothetical protein